jgi:hypothetical protein
MRSRIQPLLDRCEFQIKKKDDGIQANTTQISSLQLHNSSPYVTTPLSSDDATTKLNEIKTIAKINCYFEEFVDRIYIQKTQEERRASKPDDLDFLF